MTQKTNTIQTPVASIEVVPGTQLSQDLKHAVLIVSLVANLTVFTMWVAVQVTSRYDAQLADFLIIR